MKVQHAHRRIVWAIQKEAPEVDLQIGTTVFSLLFEEPADIMVIIQVDLLQLFQAGQKR